MSRIIIFIVIIASNKLPQGRLTGYKLMFKNTILRSRATRNMTYSNLKYNPNKIPSTLKHYYFKLSIL